jgi:hypothetical protein
MQVQASHAINVEVQFHAPRSANFIRSLAAGSAHTVSAGPVLTPLDLIKLKGFGRNAIKQFWSSPELQLCSTFCEGQSGTPGMR